MAEIGLIARADRTGLGYQTRSYYKHLKPSKTMVINISSLNGNEQQPEWYPDGIFIDGFPSPMQVKSFLHGLDVVITAETPYSFSLYTLAKSMGIKTVCVENPEFYDHIKYPEYPLPDVMILPSVWMEDEIRQHAEPRGIKVFQIHHPVDRDEHPFRLRTTNKPMHIAGKPAAMDRNGTWDFLQACPGGTITTQSQDLSYHIRKRYPSSRVLSTLHNQDDVYSYGDYLVLPRRYGGNCLILNEALSRGMPVIMTDVSPNNHLLPKEWLVESIHVDNFEPRTKVEVYSANIQALQEKIIEFNYLNMGKESQKANDIADKISWETLLPKYMEILS
jgi:hypothetical protein